MTEGRWQRAEGRGQMTGGVTRLADPRGRPRLQWRGCSVEDLGSLDRGGRGLVFETPARGPRSRGLEDETPATRTLRRGFREARGAPVPNYRRANRRPATASVTCSAATAASSVAASAVKRAVAPSDGAAWIRRRWTE